MKPASTHLKHQIKLKKKGKKKETKIETYEPLAPRKMIEKEVNQIMIQICSEEKTTSHSNK